METLSYICIYIRKRLTKEKIRIMKTMNIHRSWIMNSRRNSQNESGVCIHDIIEF